MDTYNKCIDVYLFERIGANNGRRSRPLERQGFEGHRSDLAHVPGCPGHEKGRSLEVYRGSGPLQCTIQDIRARNAGANPDEIQRIVDEAVSELRAERRAKRRADKA
jgi:hypothetical protein